jgi:hypothetical protein
MSRFASKGARWSDGLHRFLISITVGFSRLLKVVYRSNCADFTQLIVVVSLLDR